MEKNKFHFIGIGGIGMSALAHIVVERGFQVSGSDKQKSPITDQLERAGAKIFLSYDAKNLPEEEVSIVYGTAIASDNPELQEAKARGLPLLHRADLLNVLMTKKKSLLVAGTHGKTTTSSLLSHVLVVARLDPSYAIGGVVQSLGKNGGDGKGEYFVAEACESDGTFLSYPGWGAIVTNIDGDHLDYWKNKEALCAGFSQFINAIASKEHLLYCADDETLQAISPQGISYGFSENAQARILSFSNEDWTLKFTLSFQGKIFEDIQIPMIGRHNVLNSAAVFALGLKLRIQEEALRKAFSSFRGIGRRVEKKGEKRGIALYDDYGHHPTEIKTTLAGLKKAVGERRLVAVFQPHRFTRTRDCLDDFPFAFSHADLVFLTDIYSAGEAPIPGVTIERLIEKMEKEIREKLIYVPKVSLKDGVLSALKEGDVVLTIGAGDITKFGPELLEHL